MENSQALTTYQFTLDSAIAECVATKRNRTGSHKTEPLLAFRSFLQGGNLDLLSSPVDVARIAGLWANLRAPGARYPGDVSPSTFNQRLAILSSFYSFLKDTYQLEIVNPITLIKKRPVQSYASATSLELENVTEGLENINRNTREGLRDYALLSIALYTGRRASELVGLRYGHVKITGKREKRVTLTFHCKGGKIMRDMLDVETSAVFLDYLSAQYGKQLLALDDAAPVWVSYSRANAGQPISTKTLANITARYLDTSKVHALRHTFAVEGEKAGMLISELSARLGHSDEKITSLYLKQVRSADNPHGAQLAARFGIHRRGSSKTV